MKDIWLQELSEKLDLILTQSALAAKNVLTIDDVQILTGLSKSYLYRLTCEHKIPFYKPNGKLMYFDRAEIEAWMKQNRVSTMQEAEKKAISYIVAGSKGV